MISFILSSRHSQADDIGFYVQSLGGHFEIHRSKVEFYVPKENCEFMILKYPFLKVVDYIW